jgi:putative phage-type endonuclease
MQAIKINEPPAIDIHNAYIDGIMGKADSAMSKEDLWHLERRLGIGGSDVGAILGYNKYRTPLDVYREKRGEVEPQDLSDKDCVEFGNIAEEAVAQLYGIRTGNKVRRRNSSFCHPEMPWLRANVDREVVGQKKVLEIKTTDPMAFHHAYKSGQWGDGNVYQQHSDGSTELVASDDVVPDTYYFQTVHYMIVKNWDVSDLAVMIGTQKLRIYTIPLSQDLKDLVITKLYEFWFNHVIPGIPPEPTTNGDLLDLYPTSSDKTVVATPEIIETYYRLETIKAQIKALEIEAYGPSVGGKNIGGLDFKIKSFMTDAAELLIDNDGAKLNTWKHQTRKSIDTAELKKAYPKIAKELTKETTIRVFR